MRSKKRLGILALCLIGMFVIVPTVSAHPLGNFTINHFAKIHIATDHIGVDTVLDMAEIPAFQEISLLDKNQNGKADPQELVGYAERQCQSILGQLDLRLNGTPVTLKLNQAAVGFPSGAGGLLTLRLTCASASQSPALQISKNDRIDFQDNSYSGRIGWREIVVAPEGVQIAGPFVSTSVSKELTAYPQDLLSSPLDVRQVSLQIGAGAIPVAAPALSPAAQKTAGLAFGARSDRFTELITLQNLTPASILLALLIAFVWGGLHSLTPGHGKTIVGAYLVGSRGTAMHAVYLGLMTTITHTAGVFILGLITYLASRYIVPDQLFPWISIASGLLVVIIGLSLFASRLRNTRIWSAIVLRFKKPHPGESAPQPGAVQQISSISLRTPAHSHGASPVLAISSHTHAGGMIHTLADGAAHSHEAGLHSHEGGIGAHDFQVHLQAGPIPHTHGSGLHSHADSTNHTHAPEVPAHEHSIYTHTHGPGDHGHSHMPPGADGSKVSMRSLLMLGISGGLLPCPSALVVLLGAIALNRVGFGILLVLVFSLGLAAVLTGIGLLMVYARRFFDRLPLHSRFVELIPAGSAAFITLLGIGITLQALVQMGWITL